MFRTAFGFEIRNTRGVLEMAQKVIEGGIVTWRHIHEILRWLNFLASTETRFEILTASNSEASQSFWSEKVSHLGVLTRD